MLSGPDGPQAKKTDARITITIYISIYITIYCIIRSLVRRIRINS